MTTSGFRRRARGLRRLLTSAEYRQVVRLRHRPVGNVFQPYNDTLEDRYPHIVDHLRTAFTAHPAPRVLSFGCSTGEEVFSLRRWLPHAHVHGIDVNPANVATAQRRLHAEPDPGVTFEVADSTAGVPDDSFDAVLCLAVLRHGRLRELDAGTCLPYLTFGRFAETVQDLARIVRPGGYLALQHSNFRFADTATAASFEVVLEAGDRRPEDGTPLFGRDDQRLVGVGYAPVVFRKTGPGAADPSLAGPAS